MRQSTFFMMTIGIIIAAVGDAAMKWYTIVRSVDGQSTHLFPFIDVTLHRNPGITGDIAIPMWIILPLTIGVILLLIDRASALYHQNRIATLGIVAIIAGATNNCFDRIINGFTTDYLMFFSTSIINMSDVLIVGGAIIFMMYNTTNPHTQRNSIPSSPPIHHYGVVSRMFRSIVRAFRNTSHR